MLFVVLPKRGMRLAVIRTYMSGCYAQFEEDSKRYVDSMENITGQKVKGYRYLAFSIGEKQNGHSKFSVAIYGNLQEP